MHLRELWLGDFRSYARAEVRFASGLTAILGENGVDQLADQDGCQYTATLNPVEPTPVEAVNAQLH